MLFFTALISVLLSLPYLALTVPAPRVHSISSSNSNDTITYFVKNFMAFVASEPNIASRVTFDLVDRRANFKYDQHCKLEAQSIYTKDYTPCGDEAEFKLTERQISIHRFWFTDWQNVIITEAFQPTIWNGTEGRNVTVTQNGTYYSMTSEWRFPIDSMWG